MLSRSALAASITVTATLFSGLAALAATTDTGGLAGQTAGASTVTVPAVISGAGTPTGDPGTPGGPNAGPIETPGFGTTAAPDSAAARWAAAVVTAADPIPAGTSPTPKSAPPTTTPPAKTPKPPPSPTTAPTTTPPSTTPPTTNPPPSNCTGSDDGLSEATKQAREAYCENRGGE